MENETRAITVFCSEEFKKDVKIALLKKGYTNLKDGYLDIFQKGFEKFQKEKDEEV
jgi:hypothetical protein